MDGPPASYRLFRPVPPLVRGSGRALYAARHWMLLLPMLAAFAWVAVDYRGARHLGREMDILEAQGDSMHWDPTWLPGPVPDEDNFAAVPCLRGITETDDDYGWAGEKPGWQDIPGLEGLRIWFSQKPQSHQGYLLEMPQNRLWSWSDYRYSLVASGYFPVPTGDVRDEWAVLRGLDRLEPLLSQMAAASGRRYAIFLPTPRERHPNGLPEIDDADRSGSPQNCLTALLTLRYRAALACGEDTEAARVLRILFRLDEAENAERGFPPVFATQGRLFLEGMQQHLWAPDQLQAFTGMLAADGTGRATANVRRYMQYICHDRFVYGRHWFTRFMPRGRPWFQPQGWVDMDIAHALQDFRRNALNPLKAHGLSGLTALGKDYAAYRAGAGEWGALGTRALAAVLLRGEIESQLFLLAARAESARLQNGVYPDKLEPAPGTDLDGQPLRYVCEAGGRSAVVYSVGLNLADDWHGKVPPEEQPRRKSRSGAPLPPVEEEKPRETALDMRDRDWVIVLRAPGD